MVWIYGMEANTHLTRFVTRLIRPRCCLCGQLSHQMHTPLCQECYNSLAFWSHGCPCCAMPLENSWGQLCGECQQHPKPYQTMRVLGWYHGSLKRLLTRFKYHQDLQAGKALTQAWLEHCQPSTLPECLIPVPCHRSKLASRGFNQATVVGTELASALNVKLETSICSRIAPGEALILQNKDQRLRQVKNLYQTQRCRYAHVALIDDVVTSQATVITLATQLLKQGARRIDIWALARTP